LVLLVTTLSLAAFSRASYRKSSAAIFVYLDEFQNFTTLAVANWSRSCAVQGGLVLAHQTWSLERFGTPSGECGHDRVPLGAEDPRDRRELAPRFEQGFSSSAEPLDLSQLMMTVPSCISARTLHSDELRVAWSEQDDAGSGLRRS